MIYENIPKKYLKKDEYTEKLIDKLADLKYFQSCLDYYRMGLTEMLENEDNDSGRVFVLGKCINSVTNTISIFGKNMFTILKKHELVTETIVDIIKTKVDEKFKKGSIIDDLIEANGGFNQKIFNEIKDLGDAFTMDIIEYIRDNNDKKLNVSFRYGAGNFGELLNFDD